MYANTDILFYNSVIWCKSRRIIVWVSVIRWQLWMYGNINYWYWDSRLFCWNFWVTVFLWSYYLSDFSDGIEYIWSVLLFSFNYIGEKSPTPNVWVNEISLFLGRFGLHILNFIKVERRSLFWYLSRLYLEIQVFSQNIRGFWTFLVCLEPKCLEISKVYLDFG